jgi:hypothetical protein
MQGLSAELFEGYRSPERQDFLYAAGRTRPGRIVTGVSAGQSVHQYGRAADYAFKDEDDNWSWQGPWDQFGLCVRQVGLEWGGDWTRRDFVHVQHTGGLSWRELERGERPTIIDQDQLELGAGLLTHENKTVRVIVNDRFICEAIVHKGQLLGSLVEVLTAVGIPLFDHIDDQGKVYIYFR